MTPEIVTRYLKAADDQDPQAVAECFATDGVVTDEGQTYIGRDQIATWRRSLLSKWTAGDHYLHVYADYYVDRDEPVRAIEARRPDLTPITLFLHGKLADEERMRRDFSRVYVNRRYSMTLGNSQPRSGVV